MVDRKSATLVVFQHSFDQSGVNRIVFYQQNAYFFFHDFSQPWGSFTTLNQDSSMDFTTELSKSLDLIALSSSRSGSRLELPTPSLRVTWPSENKEARHCFATRLNISGGAQRSPRSLEGEFGYLRR